MLRVRTLLLIAAAAATVAAMPAVAAQRLGGPQPRLMVLTTKDVGHVSYVHAEGSTTEGPIAASRGYQRTFSGFTPASVQLLTVRDTVLLGKDPAAAQRWIASFVAASGTKAGLDRLYAQYAKGYAAAVDVPVTKGTVLRARALKAGDAAAEVVFRFTTADGAAAQVGQIYVRVGGNLSAIYFDGAMPGLTAENTRQFAVAAAARMTQGAKTV